MLYNYTDFVHFKEVFMKNSFLKRAVSLLLIFAMVLPFTGCSKFLANIASKEASKVLTDALDDFYSDPVNGPVSYDESYEVPQMLQESLDFALQGISSSTYELGEAQVNKNRTTIKIPVTFSKVIQVEDIAMGTYDEVSEALGDCDKEDVEIVFVLKSHDGDWAIEDMSELVTVFFEPYEDIVYVDENGMPTSYYEPFFEECYVDGTWYEPLMSTPLDSRTLDTAPEALTACFYFDRPMYMTFTAELVKSGEVVQTIEVVLNGNTTAYCEFWGQTYTSGSYVVDITYDGEVVAETSALTVAGR